jgi:hypothetical protein
MFYDNYNFIDQIYEFFDIPEKPLEHAEFAAFWYSLTEEEILELRQADLSTISREYK